MFNVMSNVISVYLIISYVSEMRKKVLFPINLVRPSYFHCVQVTVFAYVLQLLPPFTLPHFPIYPWYT